MLEFNKTPLWIFHVQFHIVDPLCGISSPPSAKNIFNNRKKKIAIPIPIFVQDKHQESHTWLTVF